VKEIDYPDDDSEPIPIVNCVFIEGEKVRLFYYHSQSPGNNDTLKRIENARVELYNSAYQLIEYLNYNIGGYYTGDHVIEKGELYHFALEDEEFGFTCFGTDALPVFETVLYFDTATVYYSGKNNFFQVSTVISDPGQEKNFYRFHAYRDFFKYTFSNGIKTDSVFISEPVELESNDFWFIRLGNQQFTKKELLLSDEGFNGRSILIRFGTFGLERNRHDEKNIQIRIVVSSLSETLFKYFTTLNEHLFYRQDPFSQPTSVFSNIDGGLGIFGGFKADTAYFVLPPSN
jgi:hypothetical protein